MPPPLEPGRIARPREDVHLTGWLRWLPGLHTLRHYEAAWLRHDVLAGLALTAVLVPVGIAYSVASGLPGIYGLYATLVGLLAYAMFGPSRVLVLGPDSALAALILGVVLPLSAGDPQRAIALAGMMAVVSGSLCVLAGIARLGFVTELLSKPIRYGYMNGIALTVLNSQLPALFGFSVDTSVAAVFDLAARAGVSVLGSLPQGLPAFSIPMLTQGDIVPVLLGGLAVALVSFADTSVLSRAYAARAGRFGVNE